MPHVQWCAPHTRDGSGVYRTAEAGRTAGWLPEGCLSCVVSENGAQKRAAVVQKTKASFLVDARFWHGRAVAKRKRRAWRGTVQRG
mmetsp:Transcript_15129/g.38522  ORF Transcript_15129/g.38522 Transcript_15129/m.38522 type:complete len:86 (+) Transcript_15129:121-378(+)|eukprot:3424923-Prymnesium_polylepis.1